MYIKLYKNVHQVAGNFILYFPIAHNTLCLPPKFCIHYCFGNMQSSQENLKTIVYAKFGGQTKCIMGNWEIENGFSFCRLLFDPQRKHLPPKWHSVAKNVFYSKDETIELCDTLL